MKKLISCFVSAAVLVSTALSTDFFNVSMSSPRNTDDNAAVSEKYGISGTNSLGKYIEGLTNGDTAEQTAPASSMLGASAANIDFAVTALDFDPQTGEVGVVSSQPNDCTLVISFVDDVQKNTVFKLELPVNAGEFVVTTGEADLSVLPEYYFITAELRNVMNSTVSNCFKLNKYTKKIVDIENTDISDFDEDRVVNFDEKEDTNFLVLSHDTIYAESSDNSNILVSADYDLNKYVFDCADDTVKNLKDGDLFFITPNDEDIIAIKVETVVLDGDTASVSGSDAIDDMFDFIKFNSNAETEKMDVIIEDADAEQAEEEPLLPSVAGDDDSDAPANNIPAPPGPQRLGDSGEFEKKVEFGASAEFGNEGGVFNGTHAKGKVNLGGSVTFNLEFYFYLHFKSVEAGITTTLTFDIGFSFEGEAVLSSTDLNHKMFMKLPDSVKFPLCPGCYLSVTPSLELRFEGTLTVGLSYAPTLGFTYSSDDGKEFIHKFGKDVCGLPKFEIDGTLFVGLRLTFDFVIIKPKYVSASFEAFAGLEVETKCDDPMYVGLNQGINAKCSAKTDDGTVIYMPNESESKLHRCDLCRKFDTRLKWGCGVEVEVLKKNILSIGANCSVEKAHSIDLDFADFHASKYNGKTTLDYGSCNDYKYKLTIKVYDENGDQASNAKITIKDLTLNTSSSGRLNLYCDEGTYRVRVDYDDKTEYYYISVNGRTTYEVHLGGDKEPSVVTDGTTQPTKVTSRVTTTTATSAKFEGKKPPISDAVILGDNMAGYVYQDGTLVVLGDGEMYDFRSCPFAKPASIKSVVFYEVPDGDDEDYITSIGNNFLNGATEVETVYLPGHIKSIGDCAFRNCRSLKSFRYGGEDDKTNTLKLPATLTYIGDSAFAGCSSANFGDLKIHNKITHVGYSCFESCAGIKTVNVAKSVKEIGNFAFSYCTNLTDAVIADGVKSVGYYIFNGCYALENVTLPYAGHSIDLENASDSVAFTIFGNDMHNSDLEYRSGSYYRTIPKTLKTITITGGTVIPNNAFNGMSSLTAVTVPDDVTYFGSDSFRNCSSLELLPVSGKAEIIGSCAFHNCSAAAHDEIALPATLTYIGDDAFSNCVNIKSVIVPGSVETMGSYVFSGCTKLTDVVISDGVGSIGNYIFNACYALENVTLPYAGHSIDLEPGSDSVAFTMFGNDMHNSDLEYRSGSYYRTIPKTLKTLTITGGTVIPNNAFNGMRGVAVITVPAAVTYFGASSFRDCTALTQLPVSSKAVTIADDAFRGCSSAANSKIALPSTLKTIGDGAFSGCEKIKALTIPNSVTSIGNYAFENCKTLKTLTIPKSVKTLGSYAFSGSSGLTSVVVSDGVGSIGNFIFNACYSLESVTLPYAGHSLDLKADSDSVAFTLFGSDMHNSDYEYRSASYYRTIPKTLSTIIITGGTVIPDNAFNGLSSVTTIKVPDDVTYFGSCSFLNCSKLTQLPISSKAVTIAGSAFKNCSAAAHSKIALPSALKTIGGSAFENCAGINVITVPRSVETIGDYAFSGCSGLTSATIANGVDYIGYYVFNACYSLESVKLPYAGHSIELEAGSDSVAFTLFGSDMHNSDHEYRSASYYRTIPKTLKTITITGGTVIPNNAFNGMSSLKTVKIPDGVTFIGECAFQNCSSLTQLPVTVNTETISASAFYGCTSASHDKLALPAGLTSIGGSAFANCVNIKSVTVPNTVETIGDYAFSGCTKLTDAVIADGVGYIGYYVFNACYSMESVTLPYAGHTIDLEPASDSVAFTLFGSDMHNSDYEYRSASYYRTIPKSLHTITITGGTVIPNNAFNGLSSVTCINVPDGITYYGDSSFRGCSKLNVLPITKNAATIAANAFSGCSSAVHDKLRLPASLTYIGNEAFANCVNIKSVNVPKSVETIGDYAFTSCTGITDAVISDGVGCIGYYVFNACYSLENVTLPYAGHTIELEAGSDSVAFTLFGSDMHNGEYEYRSGSYYRTIPKTLRTITITGGTVIPNNAFNGMSSVTCIKVPDGITYYGDSSFINCTSLESLPISGSAEIIANNAFRGCTAASHDKLELPEGLNFIGNEAFANCVKIRSVIVPKTVMTLGDYAFSGCSGLTDAVISDGVGSIGYYIFNACYSLENVTLPYAGHNADLATNSDSVAFTLFGSDMHNGEYEYRSASYYRTIPKTLRTITITGGSVIPDNAFNGMFSLTEITVPAELETVGSYAFNGCSGLNDVYVMNGSDNWEKVTIGEYNDPLINAVKHFKVIRIMAQPSDVSALDGNEVHFTVNAAGLDLVYKWQFSGDNGKTWEDIPEANSEICSFNAGTQNDGAMYRCVISNKYGASMTSDTAVLRVAAYLPGDADGDGVVDNLDLIALRNWIMGVEGAELSNWEVMDLCKDGVLDAFDLCLMRKLIAQSTAAPAPQSRPAVFVPAITEDAQEFSEETPVEAEMITEDTSEPEIVSEAADVQAEESDIEELSEENDAPAETETENE